jgi:hypothetical protein
MKTQNMENPKKTRKEKVKTTKRTFKKYVKQFLNFFKIGEHSKRNIYCYQKKLQQKSIIICTCKIETATCNDSKGQ